MGKRSSHAALAIRLAEIGHSGSDLPATRSRPDAEREQSYRRTRSPAKRRPAAS